MPHKILVVGANGFIGTNLTRRLIEQGHSVSILTRTNKLNAALADLPINAFCEDITGANLTDEPFRGVEYVINCAARISFNPHDYDNCFETNVTALKNIVERSRRNNVRRLVHVSAAAVFGYTTEPTGLIDETVRFAPERSNPYAYTKKMGEDILREHVAGGFDAVIANPCTVYGNYDFKMNSGYLIRNILRGRIIPVFPGGTSTVGTDDLVEGLIMLLTKGRSGENYIFSSENITYADLFKRIAAALDAGKKIWIKLPAFSRAMFHAAASVLAYVNKGEAFLTPQIIGELFSYKYYDSKKARTELGWQSRTTLETSVREALSFYKRSGLI